MNSFKSIRDISVSGRGRCFVVRTPKDWEPIQIQSLKDKNVKIDGTEYLVIKVEFGMKPLGNKYIPGDYLGLFVREN